MEKEIKFTRAKVVVLEESLSSCPEAQKAIRDAFPEAFKKKEKDITSQIKWKMQKFNDGYWLLGTYGESEEAQFYFNVNGLRFNHSDYRAEFKIKKEGNAFSIFKK